jgi:uncharacterized membrane protein
MENNTNLDMSAGKGTQPNGMATASLVLGICSIVLCWLWFIAIIAGILAIIFGIVAKNKIKENPALTGEGAAKAGIITGIIGVALIVLVIIMVFVVFASVVSAVGSDLPNMMQDFDRYN